MGLVFLGAGTIIVIFVLSLLSTTEGRAILGYGALIIIGLIVVLVLVLQKQDERDAEKSRMYKQNIVSLAQNIKTVWFPHNSNACPYGMGVSIYNGNNQFLKEFPIAVWYEEPDGSKHYDNYRSYNLVYNLMPYGTRYLCLSQDFMSRGRGRTFYQKLDTENSYAWEIK